MTAKIAITGTVTGSGAAGRVGEVAIPVPVPTALVMSEGVVSIVGVVDV